MDAGEDDFEEAGLNFISCMAWVRRGVPKLVPDKVELSQEELEQLIGKTKGELAALEEEEGDAKESEEDDDNEMQEDAEEKDGAKDKKEKIMNEDEKIDAEYGLDDYDDDEDNVMMGMENLTVFANENEDPYVTEAKDDDSEEEGDFNLLPTDNLIAVGHVEGDAAILEIHVYNAEEAHLYVHHESFLPALPLCMEWMDYNPGETEAGNYLAVGSMAPIIDIWDVDMVGALEPEFTLGRKKSKKKKLSAIGHKDAVLSLSWNKHVRNLLASGSADHNVLLWDMSRQDVASTLSHPEKIQSLQFHPFEIQTLATGCCDGSVRVYDCRSESCKDWKVDGEVERVLWDHFNPFCFLTSTETGSVFYIDARKEKPLWTLNAHTRSCTGLALSTQCPGCLITSSQDKTFKVWDIQSGTPNFVVEHDFKLGSIYTTTACPDAPFAFCIGGDNRGENFKVWDIRQSAAVLNRFERRQLVQPLLQSAAPTPASVAESTPTLTEA